MQWLCVLLYTLMHNFSVYNVNVCVFILMGGSLYGVNVYVFIPMVFFINKNVYA